MLVSQSVISQWTSQTKNNVSERLLCLSAGRQAYGDGQKEGGETVSRGPTNIYVPNVLISPRGTADLQHGPSAIRFT